jgi:hypothetical protein
MRIDDRPRSDGMPSSTALLRLILPGMAGLGIAAVLLGQCVPKPQDEPPIGPRSPAPPRYHWFKIGWSAQGAHGRYLLDAETGAILTFPRSTAVEVLDLLRCSPWRDGRGQFHLIGRWHDGVAAGVEYSPRTFGLVRCTFPAGKILDRVALDPVPTEAPCWSPDASDRVLYAAGDGRLYSYQLPAAEGPRGSAEAMPPRPLRWEIDPPGDGPIHLQDLCWPGAPALGGRLLVALNPWDNPSRAYRGLQLWWLQLGPDGTAIVAAGRLLQPDGDDAPARRVVERLPSVGTARDGTPLLAYLTRARGQDAQELWVAPIMIDATSGAPRVLAAGRRKLAEGCEAAAPAFSADGRWVYAARRHVGSGTRLERFALERFAVAPAAEAAASGVRPGDPGPGRWDGNPL